DGHRLVYSSYLGRQWHQLWVLRAEGGDPFPLTYGEFDVTAARWSRDGKRIAFISNRDGNTSLWVQDVLSGRQTPLVVRERRYRNPTGRLRIIILDPMGRPTPARVSVTGADGRAYAPDNAWVHADDSFDRAERPFEAHYFHSAGSENNAPQRGHRKSIRLDSSHLVISYAVFCMKKTNMPTHEPSH